MIGQNLVIERFFNGYKVLRYGFSIQRKRKGGVGRGGGGGEVEEVKEREEEEKEQRKRKGRKRVIEGGGEEKFGGYERWCFLFQFMLLSGIGKEDEEGEVIIKMC